MELKTVAEIAAEFGVTTTGVRYWIKNGLKTSTEKVVGIKPRIVINPDDERVFKIKIGTVKSPFFIKIIVDSLNCKCYNK